MKRNILNINGGKIEVYSFEPKHYSLDLFRLEELKTIPQEQQILRKENTRGWFTPKEGVIYECDNYIIRPFMTKKKKMEEYDAWLRIRRSYINGLYTNEPAKEYETGLITLNADRNGGKTLINLTPDAYAEYLLENEQFTKAFLEDKDLSKLKDLFSISDEPISEVSIDELKKMCESKIVPIPSFNYKMEQVEKEADVYRKLKK